jgi:predicted acylesterase/phospholipase RssA
MSQPLNIQLAIQGGGAKVCALMAAIEALEELHDKELNVTRIAGTSAGSIVGCLFAAGVPMSELKEKLVNGKLGNTLVQLFTMPNYVTLAARAYRGKAFWKTLVVEKELEELFQKRDVYYLKDLKTKKGIEVTVIAADLRDGQMFPIGQETPIVSAIMDSCGLPYCFRTWKNGVGGGPVIVDGGICENLPIDVLKQEEERFGPVAALSFFPTRRPAPSTVTSFSMALLDTAMNNAVTRAKAMLPLDQVHEIKTSITTFDFTKALREGFGEEYWRINKQATEFFEKFLKVQRKTLHHIAEDPWTETNATLKELMRNLGNIYQRQHEPIKFKYLKCDFVVIANCLLEEGEPFYGSPDGLLYELTFQPDVEPLYAVSVGLSQPKGIQYLGQTSFKLFDANHNELAIEHVPVINPKEPNAREVMLFFTPPLLPGSGPYKLRVRDQAINLMGPLHAGEMDELAYFPRRTSAPIDQINLVLHVPERLRNSISLIPPANGLGRRMTDPEVTRYTPPGGFTSFGWSGQNITKPSDGVFKVDVKLA